MSADLCDLSSKIKDVNYSNQSIIQRLSGKSKYILIVPTNATDDKNVTIYDYQSVKYNTPSDEYGKTVSSEYDILCDLSSFVKLPRYSYFFGYILGALILGFGSDRGGRKMIILSSIWTTGIMSLFQIVGNDFISYTFFSFFIGLFIGVRIYH